MVAANQKAYGSSSTISSARRVAGKLSRIIRRMTSQRTASNRNLCGLTSIMVYLSDLHVTAKVNSKKTKTMKTLARAKSTPIGIDDRKTQNMNSAPTQSPRAR